MEETEGLPPEAKVKAMNAGILPGILLVAWAVGFSFFYSDFSPTNFWIALSVSLR